MHGRRCYPACRFLTELLLSEASCSFLLLQPIPLHDCLTFPSSSLKTSAWCATSNGNRAGTVTRTIGGGVARPRTGNPRKTTVSSREHCDARDSLWTDQNLGERMPSSWGAMMSLSTTRPTSSRSNKTPSPRYALGFALPTSMMKAVNTRSIFRRIYRGLAHGF